MPLFRYQALNATGREISGVIEADDQRRAALQLREQSLIVLELARHAGGSVHDALRRDVFTAVRHGLRQLRPVRARDRVFFLRQLALMLRNGLTLLQALDVLRSQLVQPQFARAVDEMIASLQSGHSLSEAMAAHSRYFSTLTCKMVESAEISGELDDALERSALQLERAVELRRQLLTSLTYPAIVVLTSLGVAGFLVWKVIPRFSQFFASRGVALPWSTQLLLDVSGFVTEYGLAILAVLAALAGLITFVYATGYGRQRLDRSWLMIPVIGDLLTVSSMVQMSQTLATLLHSGVTLMEALRVAAQTVGNRAFSSSVSQAADRVLRGQDLAGSLRQPIIPLLVPHVVAVGERTGALAQVLDELSQFYDRELQTRIKRMTALIEPVLILVIGGMVGFVYFAFFQAVFQLASAR